jgi:hypothetical protein
MIDKFRWKV